MSLAELAIHLHHLELVRLHDFGSVGSPGSYQPLHLETAGLQLWLLRQATLVALQVSVELAIEQISALSAQVHFLLRPS